ncbi:unnamed protein product [Phytophthora fragariaefolia]|uniref:Unnamed protein product n=1 Tax=Phytophthora fragariaefolia TaxID=1490495 RepID=A0A9W6XQB2_9STRA|nr:unnamed protein product [Phytophthora fragariaefolia]
MIAFGKESSRTCHSTKSLSMTTVVTSFHLGFISLKYSRPVEIVVACSFEQIKSTTGKPLPVDVVTTKLPNIASNHIHTKFAQPMVAIHSIENKVAIESLRLLFAILNSPK